MTLADSKNERQEKKRGVHCGHRSLAYVVILFCLKIAAASRQLSHRNSYVFLYMHNNDDDDDDDCVRCL